MENLINFDENENSNKSQKRNSSPAVKNLLLVNDRLSLELNNPFDKLEYRAVHSEDPFECLEVNKMTKSVESGIDCNDQKSPSELIPNSSGFSSISSIEFSPLTTTTSGSLLNNAFVNESESDPTINSESTLNKGFADSSIASSNGSKRSLVRSQSDTSTISNNDEKEEKRFNQSVDNALLKKSNQLLKLSLLNSPNSPFHSSSLKNLSMSELVFAEARKLSEKFSEMSFEDINNISQHLIDTSNLSMNDADLEQLKISFLEKNPVDSNDASAPASKVENMQEKIEDLQEKLKKIKKEEEVDVKDVKIKPEALSPSSSEEEKKSDVEVDDILQKIKSLLKENNKDEAKKQLGKLNELLMPSEPKLLEVQPYIRQDTFEIDKTTGKRKYVHNIGGDINESNNDNINNSTGELMEKLAKLLGAQSLDIGSLNLSGSSQNSSVVVIVPKMPSPAATPIKQNNPSRRSVSFSSQRPGTSFKGIESKKLSTPMKHTATPNKLSANITSSAARRSSFTAPRPVANPYDQKLNIGAVRKSLMPSMDRSPMKTVTTVKSPVKRSCLGNRLPTVPRRSVSMKAAIPSLTVSHPSPAKSFPMTSTPMIAPNTHQNAARISSTPRHSTTASTSLKPPAGAAKSTATSLRRPATHKTEFKTPYASTSKVTSSSNAKGSLV